MVFTSTLSGYSEHGFGSFIRGKLSIRNPILSDPSAFKAALAPWLVNFPVQLEAGSREFPGLFPAPISTAGHSPRALRRQAPLQH